MDDDPGHAVAEQTRPLIPWAARLLGVVASLVGCGFVIHALASQWDEARGLLTGAEAGWLTLGWVLAAAAMVAIALPWRTAQRLVGPTLSRFDTVVLYFQGELGKYVPGAIWATVGRAELARRRGLTRIDAYAGVMLSLAGLYLACALVAVAALLTGV
ncbi:MAG: hypothetical protein LC733_08160 [Actinobacteria bacterium]|nr:hypothetical protein [Actinomycetota bacterium]